jgi:hypothetical protein
MSEGAPSHLKQVITWLIAITFGGLGGAFFNNWYANRSTVIEYSVNRTVLGTDQTTVVPDLRIQVGGASLQALYIYTVKLQYISGPELENARVGIGLQTSSSKLVGNTVAERPGEAFAIGCEPFEARNKSSGTTCMVRRFNSHVGAYTVSFATDSDAMIDVSVDAKNTRVRQAGIPGTPEASTLSVVTWAFSAIAFLAAVLGFIFSSRSQVGRESHRFYGGEASEALTLPADGGSPGMLPGARPTVTPVSYGRQDDARRNASWPGLLLANDGNRVAYEVEVEPFSIGKWEVKFAGVNRLDVGEKKSIWVDINNGNVGDSDLRKHLIEWQEANGTLWSPLEFEIRYRDPDQACFASLCELQISVNGVEVLFKKQELRRPNAPPSTT